MVQDHSQVPPQVMRHYELLKQADWYAYRCRNAQNAERPQETIPLRVRLTERQAHLRDLPQRLKVLNAVPYMGAKDVYGQTDLREQHLHYRGSRHSTVGRHVSGRR